MTTKSARFWQSRMHEFLTLVARVSTLVMTIHSSTLNQTTSVPSNSKDGMLRTEVKLCSHSQALEARVDRRITTGL